ncbi:hypothetical protein M2222_009342 [Bradyrhizobium elkanii]|uniref:hypothetical protein n=1 Tax=Bradyrhizobium elkanii TaxID=29448 RepID=UPI002167A555|nr:hypothetical protein [Bradyrhizobium elkanii]MCS3453763.1 hypothetical protein [Bradyrhizobium elkanii]MCS3566961.1 hypothetical protein [Bradyrhizobium elkanii]MCW2153861.1 hypothetical protein [Bradyrhizobium elkanii]MCW2380306.1 hypothetical protein [Bradyrhizobium elkanii]
MSEDLYGGALEKSPPDHAMAKNYVELLALLKEQQETAERGTCQSAAEFWVWDQKVQSSLTAPERSSLLEPHLLPTGPQDPDIPRKPFKPPDQESHPSTGPQNDERT